MGKSDPAAGPGGGVYHSSSLFKNGEMQGSEKIQDARCSRLHKRPGFFLADAADCRF
jgi:hypothetical protein